MSAKTGETIVPSIPQYVSQYPRIQPVRTVQPSTVDLSAVQSAASSVQSAALSSLRQEDLERQRQAEEAKQKAERLAEDEARSYVGNKLSEARVFGVERLTQAQEESPTGAAGFTATFLKDWDKWSEEAIAAAPENARRLLRDRLTAERTQFHSRAFEFETKQRHGKLVQDFEGGLQADAKVVFADPSRFQEVAAQRLALAWKFLRLSVRQRCGQRARPFRCTPQRH